MQTNRLFINSCLFSNKADIYIYIHPPICPSVDIKMTSQALDLLVDNVRYLNASLEQFKVFYREAGDPSGPTMVLLHGFPTSSHMFRLLIPTLALYMHVIAPDLPGFGLTAETQPASAATNGTGFKYTFDNLAVVVDELIIQLGVTRYFVYAMDYGAPVGFRLMAARPEYILGIVVQNGNAYEEGLTDAWDNIRRLVPTCFYLIICHIKQVHELGIECKEPCHML